MSNININTVNNLIKNGLTITEALKEVYTTRKFSIAFNDSDFNIHISELGLGNRAENALLRAGFHTLMDAINHINENGWNSIKTFGKTSAIELYEKIIEVVWDGMNETERMNFLNIVDKQNIAKGGCQN